MNSNDEGLSFRDDWPPAISRDILELVRQLPPWILHDRIQRAERRELWLLLPQRRCYRAFYRECSAIAAFYAYSLGHRKQDTPKLLTQDITNIANQLKQLNRSLQNLSEQGHRSLWHAASEVPKDSYPWRELEPRTAVVRPLNWNDEEQREAQLVAPSMGRSRVELVRKLLIDLHSWSQRAAATQAVNRKALTADKPKGGRPPHIAEREAIGGLLEVWHAQGNQLPKAYPDGVTKQYNQPFVELCRGVIQPVSELGGITPPDLGRTVSQVIKNHAE